MIDPCRNYTRMDNLEKRSTDYLENWTSDGPISDDILQDDWYRIYNDNGLYMSTSAPGQMHCGTYHPIWLNGKIIGHSLLQF